MLNQKISSAASAANPILRIAGITKSYGPKVVADNLQLAIHKGEFLTFLGASGSGKSTTLRIVAGLERADSGSVWISGRIVDDVPPWKRNLGMMFQQYAIFPHMSVAQNIGYGLRIRGQPAHVINKRVKSLLDLVGLAGMGEKVHALVRSSSANELLQHPNITVFKGDILQKESLMTAMKGCKQVYHTAARVGVWARDSSVFYDVNVGGTRNVLDAVLQSGVEKTVFTSTCGVIGPTLNEPMEENAPRTTGFEIDYDLSKKKGEDVVLQYAKEGMKIVIASPSKVYGPGNVSHSLTANAVINTFSKPSGTRPFHPSFINWS